MRILRAYLLRELLLVFAASLVIITVLFMSQRIIQLTEYAVNRGIGPAYIALLLAYNLPRVLAIVVPIVTLFSILLAVGRLSSDHEIVALKSSGVSLNRLVPPTLLFAALASLLGLFATLVMIPGAAQASGELTFRIVKTRTEAAAQPGTFVSLLRNLTFYVRDKKPDGELLGVIFSEERGPRDQVWVRRQIVIAESGRFVHDPVALENELWLANGVMVSEDKKTGRDEFVSFTSARLRLDLGTGRISRGDRLDSLSLFELREEIRELAAAGDQLEPGRAEELVKLRILFHERFCFPLAGLALCFWGIPLGVSPPRAGRSRAIVVAVLLSAVFYYLMILGKFMAIKGSVPAATAMWGPVALILASGLYMLRQKNRERPIIVLSWMEDMLYHLADLFKEWRERRRAR